MKFGVRVMPRPEVLDTQGRAVEETLKRHGHKVSDCRIGKFVWLDVASREDAEKIASSVLCNPLIETYEILES